ncbi:MAG TPA: hypothetical protein VF409_02980 [Sphingomonas sp.]
MKRLALMLAATVLASPYPARADADRDESSKDTCFDIAYGGLYSNLTSANSAACVAYLKWHAQYIASQAGQSQAAVLAKQMLMTVPHAIDAADRLEHGKREADALAVRRAVASYLDAVRQLKAGPDPVFLFMPFYAALARSEDRTGNAAEADAIYALQNRAFATLATTFLNEETGRAPNATRSDLIQRLTEATTAEAARGYLLAERSARLASKDNAKAREFSEAAEQSFLGALDWCSLLLYLDPTWGRGSLRSALVRAIAAERAFRSAPSLTIVDHPHPEESVAAGGLMDFEVDMILQQAGDARSYLEGQVTNSVNRIGIQVYAALKARLSPPTRDSVKFIPRGDGKVLVVAGTKNDAFVGEEHFFDPPLIGRAYVAAVEGH